MPLRKLIVAAALLLFAVGRAQALTAAQAKAHEGENATVCGGLKSGLSVNKDADCGDVAV